MYENDHKACDGTQIVKNTIRFVSIKRFFSY